MRKSVFALIAIIGAMFTFIILVATPCIATDQTATTLVAVRADGPSLATNSAIWGLRHSDKTPISALLASYYDASDITKASASTETLADVNRLNGEKEGVGGFFTCSQPRLYSNVIEDFQHKVG